MKLLPLLLLPLSGFCQQGNEPVAYVGMSQTVEINVPGYDCADLLASTSNGKLASTENACRYVLEAESAGTAIINIKSAEDNKLLQTISYRTERLPDPLVTVAGKTGGKIRKEVLEVQLGIVATAKKAPPGVHFVVLSFTATIPGNGDTSLVKKVNGAYFPDELKESFKQLQGGDVVLFSDIRCIGPDKRSRTVKPMEFEIVD